LKPTLQKLAEWIEKEFLYIDPLKQGLKLSTFPLRDEDPIVFIHRSIKTRIET